MAEQKRLVIDHVVVICNGCGAKQTVWFDKALVGAEELIHWMKTELKPFCACGATACDVRAHMKGSEEE